jgi:hypothetical protein
MFHSTNHKPNRLGFPRPLNRINFAPFRVLNEVIERKSIDFFATYEGVPLF